MWGVPLALLMIVGSVSAQTIEELGLKMKEAGELINAKKYVESIPVLEQVITMGIDVEGDDAAAIVSQAQGLMPKMFMQKAIALVQAKNMTGALEALNKAEELGDLYGDATTVRNASRTASNIYMAMGIENFNAKEYAKALEIFLKGTKQDPDNIKLAYLTAKSYAELGNLSQATELYRRVIAAGAANSRYEKDSVASVADLNIYTLVAISDAAAASDIATASTLLKAIPTNADANLIVIQLANKLKNYDAVIADADAAYAAQTDPAKKSEVAYLAGVAYQNKDNKAKAVEFLKKVTAGPNVAAAKELAATVAAQ